MTGATQIHPKFWLKWAARQSCFHVLSRRLISSHGAPSTAQKGRRLTDTKPLQHQHWHHVEQGAVYPAKKGRDDPQTLHVLGVQGEELGEDEADADARQEPDLQIISSWINQNAAVQAQMMYRDVHVAGRSGSCKNQMSGLYD